MSFDLFVFAGETSGDVHGATILEKLKKNNPDIRICGVAGPQMRKLGLSLFMPMENFQQIMGYTEVIKNIFKLVYLFKRTQRYILKHQPKAVLFIDYPGFNLRMAKSLRRKGFKNKLIHYICPTVWAHGKNRIYTLANTLDMLLTIFPFEKQYFKATSLKPTYIGHPLIEKTKTTNLREDWTEEFPIAHDKKCIGIFPGSRHGEIKQNLPKILQACFLFKKENPNHCFLISVANSKLKSDIHRCVFEAGFEVDKDVILIPSSHNFELMNHIEAAVASSGTITFELGILSVPTVVVYHLNPMNAWIARYCLKLDLPYYCIVNIITKKHIFPELYYLDFKSENVYHTLKELTRDSYLRKNCLTGCQEMLSIMDSEKSPSKLAAEKIGTMIYEQEAT